MQELPAFCDAELAVLDLSNVIFRRGWQCLWVGRSLTAGWEADSRLPVGAGFPPFCTAAVRGMPPQHARGSYVATAFMLAGWDEGHPSLATRVRPATDGAPLPKSYRVQSKAMLRDGLPWHAAWLPWRRGSLDAPGWWVRCTSRPRPAWHGRLWCCQGAALVCSAAQAPGGGALPTAAWL